MVRYQPQLGLTLRKLPKLPEQKWLMDYFLSLWSELSPLSWWFVFKLVFIFYQYCSSVLIKTKTYIESWLCWQCNTQRYSVQNVGGCKGEKRKQFSIWETRSEEENGMLCRHNNFVFFPLSPLQSRQNRLFRSFTDDLWMPCLSKPFKMYKWQNITNKVKLAEQLKIR